jgi:hypothetical protein
MNLEIFRKAKANLHGKAGTKIKRLRPKPHWSFPQGNLCYSMIEIKTPLLSLKESVYLFDPRIFGPGSRSKTI